MARKITLVDDIDESDSNVESVSFGYKGTDYNIDLSDKNREKLEKALAPFLEHGTRVSASSRGGSVSHAGPRSATKSNPERTKRIKAWADQQEPRLEYSPQGRLPGSLVSAYEEATGDVA